MNYPILIAQVLISVALTGVILLQAKGGGLGSAFGGGSFKTSRHGFDKVLFNTTIILAIIFVITSVANFIWG